MSDVESYEIMELESDIESLRETLRETRNELFELRERVEVLEAKPSRKKRQATTEEAFEASYQESLARLRKERGAS